MNYTTIATNGMNGPIVGGLNAATVLELLGYFTIFNWTDFSNLLESLVNQDISQAETDEPEGQRIELDITGLDGQAAWVAGQIQNYYADGDIKASDGSVITPWPEYPGQIAWGDSSTDTLTLRWVKEDPFVWILVGVLIVALGVGIYYVLTNSSYSMSAANPSSSQNSSSSTPTVSSSIEWLLKNAWWLLPGAGVLAALPWLIRQSRKTYEEGKELEEDVEGE